ncbi:methyl-CpG-binding domain-containing protein 5-like protein [Carex littledalei]|uniref:Methyl-CpG-binding domain-containing protein 5-like protein n=1 Tax=Carex littledalei TaxID=544730 RepID=A0A833V9R6_9POAL|nr:methyl-CpG-binding domain-containing protein 5-like protein [Carex littledalei]
MAASSDPEVVLNPVPISFAPPDTKGVPIGSVNPTPSVGETPNSTKRVKKSKKSKVNEESPSVSTESKKAKKLKTDEVQKKSKTDEDAPSVSSEFKRPDWLPEGWTIIERVREGGKTAGSKDKYYIEPGTGKKFRSQVEVRRHLGLLDEPLKPNEKNNSPKTKPSGFSNKQKDDKETAAASGDDNKKNKLEEDAKISGDESAKKPKEV